MKSVKQHIEAFAKLGDYLVQIDTELPHYAPLMKIIHQSKHKNGWFTEENCLNALKSWGEALNERAINEWTTAYTFTEKTPQNIGLVLAGNIPLVGFHDVLCVLLCGHNATIKLASTDPYLIPFLNQQLIKIDPVFEGRLTFTEERLEQFDAVIATGSNNAARYFDYYFSKVPNIIRKNRNGIAVLDGNENKQQLEGLAKDIVQYYGLGCRSIAKVYLPRGYDINHIFGALYPYAHLMESAKYANNYDYNKAVFLMSEYDLLDNGFMLVRESDAFGSPVACLHYAYYDELSSLQEKLHEQADQIQCISSALAIENAIPLGEAQSPSLWNYADGVDPIRFLLGL